MFCAPHPIHDSHFFFVECDPAKPTSLVLKVVSYWDRAFVMDADPCSSLIYGHEEELSIQQHALHVRCYILVTICHGVVPMLLQVSFMVECAESPFPFYTEKVWYVTTVLI